MIADDLHPVRIMLVDDCESDRLLTRRAFRRMKLSNELNDAEDGDSALERLQDLALPLPDLILLDVNMPGMSGHEFLARVKQDDRLRRIPVVMLTSSDSHDDVARAYDTHCSGYIRKPVDSAGLQNAVNLLADYWFVLVKRPG